MTTNHPITPPPELVGQWVQEVYGLEGMPGPAPGKLPLHIATQAARWGADHELEAMLAELKAMHLPDGYADRLRAARRPKSPSLKELARKELEEIMDKLHESTGSGVDLAAGLGLVASAINEAISRLPD